MLVRRAKVLFLPVLPGSSSPEVLLLAAKRFIVLEWPLFKSITKNSKFPVKTKIQTEFLVFFFAFSVVYFL